MSRYMRSGSVHLSDCHCEKLGCLAWHSARNSPFSSACFFCRSLRHACCYWKADFSYVRQRFPVNPNSEVVTRSIRSVTRWGDMHKSIPLEVHSPVAVDTTVVITDKSVVQKLILLLSHEFCLPSLAGKIGGSTYWVSLSSQVKSIAIWPFLNMQSLQMTWASYYFLRLFFFVYLWPF